MSSPTQKLKMGGGGVGNDMNFDNVELFSCCFCAGKCISFAKILKRLVIVPHPFKHTELLNTDMFNVEFLMSIHFNVEQKTQKLELC